MRKKLKAISLFSVSVVSCLLIVFSSVEALPSPTNLVAQLNAATAKQVCHNNPNTSGCPQAAYIWEIIGGVVRRVVYYPAGENAEPISNPRSQILYGQHRLSIPGDGDLGALLRFVSRIEDARNSLIPGYLVSAGFHRSTTVYKYPCTFVGSFTIGWQAQEDSPACDGGEALYNPALQEAENGYIRTRSNNVDPRTSNPGPRSYEKQLSHSDALKQAGPGNPNAVEGALVNLRLYCSVVASSGPGWQVGMVSGTEADLSTLCNQTIEACEMSSRNTCFIVKQGYWRAYHPKLFLRQVRLHFQCAESEPFYDAIIEGTEVEKEWSTLSERAVNASSCILSIYNPDDILIVPDPTQKTLMHVDDNADQVRITSLVGSLTINQPGNADQVGTQPNDISRGERIELESGEQLSLLNTTGVTTEINLDRNKRKEIIGLPVIQSFLRIENWELLFGNDPVQKQIQEFRDALNEQFLQPLPIKIIDGSGRITSSNVREVSVGRSLSGAAGSYNPSTNTITLEISGKQAEMKLNSPLEDNRSITFGVRRLSPSEGPSLLEGAINIFVSPEREWGGGTLRKEGDTISGDVTIRSPFRRGSVREENGLVTGIFSLTVENP